jgi:hypothetical protein
MTETTMELGSLSSAIDEHNDKKQQHKRIVLKK